jgi:phosphoserine phosphatase RsbU/P
MKILLVDDDPTVRRMHSHLLHACGHEVLEAPDGEAAWQVVEAENINFVVSDWMMPKLAGVDLCRRIRAANWDRYIYVILCTGRGQKADLIEGMDAGADDFLVKPITADELRVKVRAGERVLKLEEGLEDKNRELEAINNRLQSAYQVLQDDLKAAAWVQEQLLPPVSPQAHGVRCEWYFHPSSYLAGDTLNFFKVDENHVGFYLLDVSGHGVPAALLSVALSLVLNPEAMSGSPLKTYNRSTGSYEAVSPADVIYELNRRFQANGDRYFTMVYGLLNTQSSILQVAQAGHPTPVLMRPGCKLKFVGTGGMPIGLWADIEFDSFELSVARGDRLLFYSDGVTECSNQDGEMFGEKRLADYLEKASGSSLAAIPAGLYDAIRGWRGGAGLEDDVSLLAVEIP